MKVPYTRKEWMTALATFEFDAARITATVDALAAAREALEDLCEQVRKGGPFDTLNAREVLARSKPKEE